MHKKLSITIASAGASLIAATTLLTNTAVAQRVYEDVPSAHWAYNAVQWASQLGIMVGPGNRPGFFNAATFANRAEVATVMYRMYNLLDRKLTNLQVRVDLMGDRLDALEGKTSSARSSAHSSSSALSYSVSLTGAQEVPMVNTNGNGTAWFSWNETTNALTYDIAVSNLSSSIIAAHFHTGAAGQAGPAIRDINFSGNRATGTWSNLSSQQRIDLFAGRIYVNVHTSSNPDGEVRGQVNVTGGSSSSMSSSLSSMSSMSSVSSVASSSVSS